ncbi:O-methyltransferase [Saccharicrinis carchari]|uniref:O-methyltransferase n=1 Tax=Saccharicrinis carchari TaxID=1168039 RepID=A0A521EFV6_SACCC|nr:TylF/MycF/NovP-related O-methyltransferase [Saccharicrinis carchari]SMO82768.1 O-methyltransferase [Saccharicrinis carchari]
MNIILYINLLLVNIVAWLAISYFWSFWTFKVFKPYQWLEMCKKKKVPTTIKRMERKFKDRNRFYSIWFVLQGIINKNIPGQLAEVGVYKGHTAKLVHHMLPERVLYLFDSFSGLPAQVIREDCDGTVRPHTVNFEHTSQKQVENYIKGNHKVKIFKGIFPETAKGIGNEKFAFVHLDADLYQSTLDGLQFFYPRLAPGGSILVHDYNHNWEGVRKAVNEFELTVPEQFVELIDMYGSVLLTKNKT